MNLTPAQQRAVHTIDRPLGIIAGAGAGKTRVLVERCVHLLRTTDLQLHQLMAITFTDRAAQELRARLAAQLPPSLHGALHGAAITTFHGLALRLLQAHAPRVGLSPHFRLLDAIAAAHLCHHTLARTLHERLERRDPALRHLLTLYTFRQIAEGLERLLADRWNVEQWRRERVTIDRLCEIPPATAPESTILEATYALFAICTAEFASVKRRQHALDFHDLEVLALQLVREQPAILADYQQQFRHILVDEFQDTNVVQMTLIQQLFTPPDNVLCIVGDPKQSIYRFRGAQRDCFQQMLTTIAEIGGEIITLNDNFRSRAPVIDFVHAACPDIPSDQQMRATRDSAPWHPHVTIVPIAEGTHRRAEEASRIAMQLRTLVDCGRYRAGDIACLFPTRLAMRAYTEAFRAHGLPTHVYGGQGLLSRRAVVDLLYALDVVAALHRQQPDDTRLLALLRTPIFGLNDDECYQLVHCQAISGHKAPQATPATLPPLHRAVATRAPAIWDHLQRWLDLVPFLSPCALLRRIGHDTAYLDVLATVDPQGMHVAIVEQFLHFSDTLSTNAEITLPDFLSRIRYMQAASARVQEAPITAAGDDAVQCMTIHAAKGNEFPVVVVADLAGQRPPRMEAWYFRAEFGLAIRDLAPERSAARKDAQSPRWVRCKALEKDAAAAESDRLLYVALTRAVDALIIPVPDGETSPWLERVRGACRTLGIAVDESVVASNTQGAQSSPEREQSAQPAPRLLQHPRVFPPHITVSALEAYDRCPQEYYLKYVAGVPAETLTWPDPQVVPAHVRGDIVHAALQQAATADISPPQAARHELVRRGWDPALADHAPLSTLLAAGTAIVERLPAERHTEYPFRLRLGPNHPTLITGTMDCLMRTKAGWEILDYKTDRIDPSALQSTADLYALQMTIYALAASLAGLQPLHATTLAFLDAAAQTISQSITPERLAHGRDQLQQLLQRIAAQTFTLPASAAPPCARCAYHHNRMCAHDRLLAKSQNSRSSCAADRDAQTTRSDSCHHSDSPVRASRPE